MAEGENAFAGLNKNGVIVFIILLLFCIPLCWLPWVIDSMKAAPEGGGEAPAPDSGGDAAAEAGGEDEDEDEDEEKNEP